MWFSTKKEFKRTWSLTRIFHWFRITINLLSDLQSWSTTWYLQWRIDYELGVEHFFSLKRFSLGFMPLDCLNLIHKFSQCCGLSSSVTPLSTEVTVHHTYPHPHPSSWVTSLKSCTSSWMEMLAVFCDTEHLNTVIDKVWIISIVRTWCSGYFVSRLCWGSRKILAIFGPQ